MLFLASEGAECLLVSPEFIVLTCCVFRFAEGDLDSEKGARSVCRYRRADGVDWRSDAVDRDTVLDKALHVDVGGGEGLQF